MRKEFLEEELALVENYIKFLDRRRTGGILYIPDEFVTAPDPEYSGEGDDELVETLMAAMLEAVQDRQSASALIPIILRGPADLKESVRHIDLDSEFYSTLCARAYKLKAQIEELDNDE